MSGLAETKETDRYKECNHHHEIDETCQCVINCGTGDFVADTQMIPLLRALNDNEIVTRSHNYSLENGNSWVVIKLDGNIHFDLQYKDGAPELVLRWSQKPGKVKDIGL